MMKLWYFDRDRDELVFMDPSPDDRRTHNATFARAALEAAGWFADFTAMAMMLPTTSRGKVSF